MRSRHLLAALVALAAITFITANASAYYHPTVGRFLQRDPGPGGSTRVGAAAASGGGFIPRDQYADGMNLYQYCGSNPMTRTDPHGTTWGDFWNKVFGNSVKKAWGLNAAAIAQAKIWGLDGVQGGASTALLFFADTCEIGWFQINAGMVRIIDGKDPLDGGEKYEGGGQLGIALSIELATMKGPSPAGVDSFEGVFHTAQVSFALEGIPVAAGAYFGDARAGRRWFGGTAGIGPGAGGGTVDWNYTKLKSWNLLDIPAAGICACYALTKKIPSIADLP